MKKLIYYPENQLSPKGGPAGYLYNLYNEVKKTRDDFYLLPPENDITDNKKLRDVVPNWIKEKRRLVNILNLTKKEKVAKVNFDEYGLIHFHSVQEMFLCRRQLDSYHGIVVLTSHAPCAFHQELIATLNPRDAKKYVEKLNQLSIIDKYAFERADYVVFPCQEAEEPYYHTWSEYSQIRNSEKIRYLPTGINPCFASVSRNEIRKKYGIPENAFVVSYVGRHTEIKGYLDLLEIGKQLLEYENIYFLIAGREEPIQGLKHQNWIEAGWTKDPHSIVAASDVFVLPNRETYFDLVLLEVMSLGKPIVLSNTGGNKYFKRFNSDALFFYQSVEEAVETLKRLHKYEIPSGERNRDIFKESFTVQTFANNYIELIDSLLRKG